MLCVTAGLFFRNIYNHHKSQLSWLYQPDEGLVAFEFCTEAVTYLLELFDMLKNTIFWDIMPCGPLKVKHSVISQKTELFITIAVRTSNPTYPVC
jgi:hypothetical protein